MKKQEQKTQDIREKILKGLDLAFERLLKQKQKDDGEFVFYENGKIVHIKAKDFTMESSSSNA